MRMGFGGHSPTKGMGMETKTVKVCRITIVADEGWLNAINEMTSYVESGEVCFYEEWSEPFDYELELEEEDEDDSES